MIRAPRLSWEKLKMYRYRTMRDTDKNWEVGGLITLIPFTMVTAGPGALILCTLIYDCFRGGNEWGLTDKALAGFFLVISVVMIVPPAVLWIVFFGSHRKK